MALSNSQTRCLGCSDLSPMAPACPKRNDCARCADIAGRDSYAGNPVLLDVQMHLCSDPELSQFIGVEVGWHERNFGAQPDISQSCERSCRSIQHPKGGKATSDPASCDGVDAC